MTVWYSLTEARELNPTNCRIYIEPHTEKGEHAQNDIELYGNPHGERGT